ncbi:MAG: MarR family transcriptional regulator [Candidatus Bathyarchaeota archaeon]|nr:MarR family transcriptional regulator [Candidatus Bathyarchaeota archaeon]MDW8039970.1 MarR family transcriptional regulator [Nitrososphaerota archaeon]
MEVALILLFVFFAIGVGFTVEYYRRLDKVKATCEKAKAAFDYIILSFSRELKRVAEGVETVAYKAEIASAKSNEAMSKVEALGGKMKALENKVGKGLEDWNNLLARLEDLEKQLRDVAASHKELATKVYLIEEKGKQTSALPEIGIETAIPIRRERALAHLTETELAVLEMLAAEGPKTAPEIKEKIKLSREHTARLMKKLYEEGYLERDSSKIPFKYRVKKEMENLLKKTKTEPV